MAGKLYGLGISDAGYVVARKIKDKNGRDSWWRCPYYRVWSSLFFRCYSSKSKKIAYENTSIDERWLRFSEFRQWMVGRDWQGKQIDKDFLGDGSVYSPNVCVFVSGDLNKFITQRENDRGLLPIGVTLTRNGRYASQCSNPFTKKRGHIGVFGCPEEAHKAWVSKKREFALIYANSPLGVHFDDIRVAEKLRIKYND